MPASRLPREPPALQHRPVGSSPTAEKAGAAVAARGDSLAWRFPRGVERGAVDSGAGVGALRGGRRCPGQVWKPCTGRGRGQGQGRHNERCFPLTFLGLQQTPPPTALPPPTASGTHALWPKERGGDLQLGQKRVRAGAAGHPGDRQPWDSPTGPAGAGSWHTGWRGWKAWGGQMGWGLGSTPTQALWAPETQSPHSRSLDKLTGTNSLPRWPRADSGPDDAGDTGLPAGGHRVPTEQPGLQ